VKDHPEEGGHKTLGRQRVDFINQGRVAIRFVVEDRCKVPKTSILDIFRVLFIVF